MSRRTLSAAEARGGSVPDDLTGVEWLDGTRQCRFAVLGQRAEPPFRVAFVLTDPGIACDSCQDYCDS